MAAGGMFGRRHAWQGACVAGEGGINGSWGHAWQEGMHGRGACMAGAHAWQGGMCGRGHAWQGGIYGRGHAWQGDMCSRGCAWQILRDGMHSCYSMRVVAYIHQLHSVPECGKYYLSPLSEEISLTYHLSPKG